MENNLKVIISTNTINLQEQLINKDIPLVKLLMSKDFKYTLVKGRGNYICKRKLQNAINEEADDGDDKEAVTGWRASEVSVTGALLYGIFIFQSCIYLIMYVKRLFYVIMLSMFGPIIVIYDFFMKSVG